MISSITHKQSNSWTFLNDAMAISAKEIPKNHTDKERFAAASSRIQTGILTLLYPRKRRRSSRSPFISHRVLEAVTPRIVKSLIMARCKMWGRGPRVRDTGPRGVENMGCGQHRVWWKTRGLSGKRGGTIFRPTMKSKFCYFKLQ